jgi:hypothetical protein
MGAAIRSLTSPDSPGEIPMKTSAKKRSKSSKKVNKKRARRKKFLRDQTLEMINPNAAGIDVASEEMWVYVPEDRVNQPEGHVRKFGAFTCDLYAIADWLQEYGVTSVAMESTDVCWIPLYHVLEERGFEVCFVHDKERGKIIIKRSLHKKILALITRVHSLRTMEWGKIGNWVLTVG